MKLRNKKTGGILPLQMTINGKEYQSLAEFNEDWKDLEDYKPKEPLIKDEKIRKAVRAWAEANMPTKVLYQKEINRLVYKDAVIDFIKHIEPLEDSTWYSIAELCGEE